MKTVISARIVYTWNDQQLNEAELRRHTIEGLTTLPYLWNCPDRFGIAHYYTMRIEILED